MISHSQDRYKDFFPTNIPNIEGLLAREVAKALSKDKGIPTLNAVNAAKQFQHGI